MLVFTGDINLTDNAFDIGYGVGFQIAKGLDPFRKIVKRSSDIWIGNFEGVCSDFSVRRGYYKEMFRLPSCYIKNCSGLIDYFGIANNHVMEHGPDAYRQMTCVLNEMSSGVFGSNEIKSIIIDREKSKIAITGFSLRNDQLNCTPLYWASPDNTDLEEEYKTIENTDFKIAYIHWGVEFVDHPYDEQRRFAHWLIDLGYDLIIGMHPHVMQGFELYKNKYIFYSLGNFVFNMAWNPTKYGLIVKLDTKDWKVVYEYIKIDEDFCPNIIQEQYVPAELKMNNLCKRIPSYQNLEDYVKEADMGLRAYRKANYKQIMGNIMKYNYKVMGAMALDFVKRRF